MSVNHEAVASLPVGGPADAALMRAMCERRFSYSLTGAESSLNLVAVDPATGVVPLYLLQNSTLFAYDSTDSTTAHDGVTCLVSFEGKRFKSGTISPPYSVLTKSTTAQPALPSVGNRYLIPTAATGTDWAGQDSKIGIYTAAGWRFAVSPVGRFLYVEDETAFYHRNAAGNWQAGIGSIALGAGSVTISNVLGASASFVIKVENQTTNAPPGSPVTPTAYIIGPSPTGAWAGNTGKLAMCLAAGSFTIITPVLGDEVFDKSLNTKYQFNGSAWISAAGSWVGRASVFTASGSTAFAFLAASFNYSATSAPTTSLRRLIDSVGLPYTAKKSGATLRIHYSADVTFTTGSTSEGLTGNLVIALFRDSVTSAIDWQLATSGIDKFLTGSAVSALAHLDNWFEVTAPDASSHTYSVAIISKYSVANVMTDAGNLSRRLLEIEESA